MTCAQRPGSRRTAGRGKGGQAVRICLVQVSCAVACCAVCGSFRSGGTSKTGAEPRCYPNSTKQASKQASVHAIQHARHARMQVMQGKGQKRRGRWHVPAGCDLPPPPPHSCTPGTQRPGRLPRPGRLHWRCQRPLRGQCRQGQRQLPPRARRPAAPAALPAAASACALSRPAAGGAPRGSARKGGVGVRVSGTKRESEGVRVSGGRESGKPIQGTSPLPLSFRSCTSL